MLIRIKGQRVEKQTYFLTLKSILNMQRQRQRQAEAEAMDCNSFARPLLCRPRGRADTMKDSINSFPRQTQQGNTLRRGAGTAQRTPEAILLRLGGRVS